MLDKFHFLEIPPGFEEVAEGRSLCLADGDKLLPLSTLHRLLDVNSNQQTDRSFGQSEKTSFVLFLPSESRLRIPPKEK